MTHPRGSFSLSQIILDSSCIRGNGILLPKFFWPTVRKKCSSDREKLLKFEAEGQDFAKNFRSLEQFIQAGKVKTIFGNRMLF